MKTLLAVSAIVLGILSIPAALIWFILLWVGIINVIQAMKGTASLSLNELTLVLPYATGSWAWCALGWLAFHFRQLGTSAPPRWVFTGIISGVLTIFIPLVFFAFNEGSYKSIVPKSYSDWLVALLFGGAPILFGLIAAIRYRLGSHGHTHASVAK